MALASEASRLSNQEHVSRRLLASISNSGPGSALSNDDPEVATLRRKAAEHIEAGAFDVARAKLLAASERDREAQEELEEGARARRLSRTASEAELGDLARVRLG